MRTPVIIKEKETQTLVILTAIILLFYPGNVSRKLFLLTLQEKILKETMPPIAFKFDGIFDNCMV